MRKLIIVLMIVVLAKSSVGRYPDCVDCSDGLTPLSPLSYNTIKSHVFSGTQPSNGGCTDDGSIDGQMTTDCGQGTALLDCDSNFNGGNFSDLSNTPIFTWNKTASVSQQVSIVFRFDQQISLGVIRMFFWTSLSDEIIVPNVNVYYSDNSTIPSTEFTTSRGTSGNGTIGRHILTINISHRELKFRYVRITMGFGVTCEWIFLSEVEFCGTTAPYRITQPAAVVQIIPSTMTTNMTCSVNDTTSCNVSFSWLYNDSEIRETWHNRYSIVEDDITTTLQVENLQPSDAGMYQCVASGLPNGWMLRRTIRLVVQTSCTHLSISASGRIVPCNSGESGMHRTEDSCNFTCNTGFEMTGNDAGTCRQVSGNWSDNESPCKRVHCNTTNADINCTSDTTTTGMFDEGGCAFCCNAEQGVTTNGRCLLDHGWTIGDPLCITGQIIGSDPVVERPGNSTSGSDPEDTNSEEIPGSNIIYPSCKSCTPNGTCEEYLSVYEHEVKYAVNVTHSGNTSYCMTDAETFAAVLNNFDNIHSHCSNILLPSVCRWVYFPTCDPALSVPVPQRVCRRACEILTIFVCPEAWRLYIEQYHILSVPKGSSFTCDNLMYANGGDLPDCIDPLDGGEIPGYSITTDCFIGRGRGYNGTISRTRSGKTCQRWSEQAPHQFILPSSQYPEIAGGHNYCRNPGSRAPEGPWCFTTDPNTRWEYCDVPKCDLPTSCELYYNGSDICFKYGSIGKDYVFINRSLDTKDDLNSKLLAFSNTLYNSTDSKNFSAECIDLIVGLMCHHSFPLCDYNSHTPTSRKVCKSYCEEVSTRNCMELWSFITTNRIMDLPDCKTLPSPEGGDHLECFIPYNNGRARRDFNSTDCYTDEDLGIHYNGTVNVTASNRTCQRWDAGTPHFHPLTSLYRPYLDGHNYCRNPEGRGKRPWCYTTDPNVRWEYCNVSFCPNKPCINDNNNNGNSLVTVVAIATSIILFMLVIMAVVLVSVCMWTIKKRKDKFVLYVSNVHEIDNASPPLDNDYVLNPTMTASDKLPNFPRENITCISDLGQGNYGKVIKGKAKDIIPGQSSTLVATKVLKEGSNSYSRNDFIQEAKLVNRFDHPNILKLLGVCFDREPFYIIFEYMNLGDLNSYLRSNVDMDGTSPSSSNLTIQLLVDMAINIAAGLDYLAEHHFVHRDLATRNCLLNEQLLVKISDFGLSKDVYCRDYYRLNSKSVLPIRWMPPEAILYRKFSTQSDVWSFGIVLWEIFAGGAQPYYTLSNEEVVDYVKKKNVLRCPSGCPSELYDLMVNCWTTNPKNRPTASEVHARLENWNLRYSNATPLKSPKVSELEVDTASPSQLILETTV